VNAPVHTAASIQPRDRLAFTLFLAISLHAALILGVGVSSDLNLERTPSIEVTLAVSNDARQPEHADYIAATNQIGSGTGRSELEPTTRERSPFHDSTITRVEHVEMPAPAQSSDPSVSALTTTSESETAAATEDQLLERLPTPSFQPQSYESLLQDIASLEARLSEEDQRNANGPRTGRLTQVSAKSAAEAAYLNTWREKVERVGNANFPEAGLFGDLRLLVVLREDGTLADVRVISSSGYEPLDAAAERIVRLAAPFQPFPVEMRKKYDQLEIIRTWKFSRKGTALR
jgi:periplasmic protein TonB